jgi:signal transduction histidine kinase/AmiR/NasT family two-component response regulator
MLVPLLALGALLAPQREIAREWAERQAALTQGSPAWFAAGLERVEAELEHDVDRARASAEELAALAQGSASMNERLVAEELAALAVAMKDGPARVARAGADLAQESPAVLRAHFHLARARRLWLAVRPTEVLVETLAALRAARECGAPAPFLRVAWFLHDITEDESLDLDRELLAEIEARSGEPDGRAFEAFRRLTEYWRTWSALSADERRRHLNETAALADVLGDVRTLVQVEWDLAVLSAEAGELDSAIARLESALGRSARAGFLREEVVSAAIAAELAFEHGEPESAELFLELAGERLAGTGLADLAIRQAHLELRRASAHGSGADVVAATRALEDLRKEAEERQQEYQVVRQPLFADELARLSSRRELERERARLQSLVAVGLSALLALLALAAFLAQRRLARVNRQLRQEMERAEAEGAARRDLERRMHLLERSESLGWVASGIAHDFNNLMTGLLGSAELLRARHADPESARQLDVIGGCVERGVRLCRQLQAYAGGEPGTLERVEVTALVRELAPALAAAAGGGVALSVEPAEGPIHTLADRSQLEQALLNLVTNARDARARTVRLGVRRERRAAGDWQGEFYRGEARAGEFVCLVVEDDGEGLSPALLERVFDPFFTTRFPGRGLGLAVVLGVVRRHRGVVAVHSQPGAGACFRIYLAPRDERPVESVFVPRPTHGLPPAADPMRVLVVDDEPPVRAFVRAFLESRGHLVRVSSDGSDAQALLAELGSGPRRLALVDLSMPTLDGRDLVRVLRAIPEPPAIVLMTGHSEAQAHETARELGVEGCIVKPFLPGALERTLAEALERHAQRARVEWAVT